VNANEKKKGRKVGGEAKKRRLESAVFSRKKGLYCSKAISPSLSTQGREMIFYKSKIPSPGIGEDHARKYAIIWPRATPCQIWT